MELVRNRLDLILALLENAGRLYRNAVGDQRKWLNQAVSASIAIDISDDHPHPTQETPAISMTGDLAEPAAAATGLVGWARTAGRAARSPTTARQEPRTAACRGKTKPPRSFRLPGVST